MKKRIGLSPKERREVEKLRKTIGKEIFSKVEGIVSKASLDRLSKTNPLGLTEIQRKAQEFDTELDRYEGICSRDPGLYNWWKTAKQNLHLIVTYYKEKE
ncbi:MAG: hypothetical protein N3G19_00180 [Candidatus Pacearchaeota archaeon]|nr:hypothetical protein [Candidatus Pacearchaeota archaeon]